MSDEQPTVPVSSTAAKDSAVPEPRWQRLAGLVVMLLSAVLAVLAILHGVSRIAVLGWGGFQLPSPQAWLGFTQDPAKTWLFAVEVWGGVLAVWGSYLSVVVALTAWGLPRLGDPKERTSLQNLIGEALGVLFALLAAVVGLVTTISVRDETITTIGVPMVVLVVPVFLGSLGILQATLRSFIVAYRAVKAESPAPRAASGTKKTSTRTSATRVGKTGKSAPAKRGKTPRNAPKVIRVQATGRNVPRKPGSPKGGAK